MILQVVVALIASWTSQAFRLAPFRGRADAAAASGALTGILRYAHVHLSEIEVIGSEHLIKFRDGRDLETALGTRVTEDVACLGEFRGDLQDRLPLYSLDVLCDLFHSKGHGGARAGTGGARENAGRPSGTGVPQALSPAKLLTPEQKWQFAVLCVGLLRRLCPSGDALAFSDVFRQC